MSSQISNLTKRQMDRIELKQKSITESFGRLAEILNNHAAHINLIEARLIELGFLEKPKDPEPEPREETAEPDPPKLSLVEEDPE